MADFKRIPENGMGLEWRADFLPNQSFRICFPENFTARDAEAFLGYWNTEMEWNLSENVAEGVATGELAELHLRVFQEAEQRALHWHMSVKNVSKDALDEVSAFNCFNLAGAPLFQDLSMTRTRVRDVTGDWCELRRIPKTTGCRTIQFYPATGGIALDGHPWVKQCELTAEQTLSGNSITVESTDGRWIVENAVQGSVAFFFNNWEPQAGCIHVAPLYGSVLPGEEAMAKGTIRFASRCRQTDCAADADLL